MFERDRVANQPKSLATEQYPRKRLLNSSANGPMVGNAYSSFLRSQPRSTPFLSIYPNAVASQARHEMYCTIPSFVGNRSPKFLTSSLLGGYLYDRPSLGAIQEKTMCSFLLVSKSITIDHSRSPLPKQRGSIPRQTAASYESHLWSQDSHTWLDAIYQMYSFPHKVLNRHRPPTYFPAHGVLRYEELYDVCASY